MSGGWRRATGGCRLRHTGLRSAVLPLLGLLVGVGPVAAQVEVVEYYATDAVGSVRVVFNADGQVVARADYQPFGELFAPVGELPPQQFTGQARDGEAGLDYFGARFYQPRHGRFTQVDPVYAGLFDPQQWNRYTYARANPLSFVDPDGRYPGIRIFSWSWSWLAEFLGRTDGSGGGGASNAGGPDSSPGVGCIDQGDRVGCGGGSGGVPVVVTKPDPDPCPPGDCPEPPKPPKPPGPSTTTTTSTSGDGESDACLGDDSTIQFLDLGGFFTGAVLGFDGAVGIWWDETSGAGGVYRSGGVAVGLGFGGGFSRGSIAGWSNFQGQSVHLQGGIGAWGVGAYRDGMNQRRTGWEFGLGGRPALPSLKSFWGAAASRLTTTATVLRKGKC